MKKPCIEADYINKKPILKTGVNKEVKECIEFINSWLEELQILVGDDDNMYSPLTGEVIQGDELWRVHGILSALYENKDFEIVRL